MEKIGDRMLIRIWSTLGLVAAIVIWFLPWRFQTNDDELMMWLVSGAYTGFPESYAVFIHPMLSWLFSELYSVFPEVFWYPFLWFSILYLSYFGLLKVLLHSKTQIQVRLVLATILLCLLIHFLFFLQFTIVSGFAALAGFCLISSSHPKISRSLLMNVLLIFSILIRWESFVLVGLGFLGYLIFFNPSLLRSRTIVLISLLAMVLVGIISKTVWEKSSSYSTFVAYNQARAAVSDHPVKFRHITEKEIKPDSKWFYFSQWMMDEDQITIEELQEKKRDLDSELFTRAQFRSSFSRLLNILKAEAFKTVFSIILISCYFLTAHDWKKKLLIFLCWMMFFSVFNHFFILNGRVIILFMFPFLLVSIISPITLSEKIAYPIIILLVVMISIHVWNSLEEARGRRIMREEFLTLENSTPFGSLLIIEGYKENYLRIPYSKINPVPFISFGWISKSPFQIKALKRFGLNSILDAEEYYLFGVDVYDEFFFEGYMNFRSQEKYELKEKIQSENWKRFHFVRSKP